MAFDKSQPEYVDLDHTDALPVEEGTLVDDDVADDAVPLEHATEMPALSSDLPGLAESLRSVEQRIARQGAENAALSHAYELARTAESVAATRAIELAAELAAMRTALETEQARSRDIGKSLADNRTALAESARALADETERAAGEVARADAALREAERYKSELESALREAERQRGELESVQREAERQRSELELSQRAAQLEKDEFGRSQRAAQLEKDELEQSQRDAERHRSEAQRHQQDAERYKSEAERHQQEAERYKSEAERHHSESRTLHDALAESDAEIRHVQHALDERDAQLNALQREHAKVVPALEARSKTAAQLDADVQAARASREAVALELKNSKESVAALNERLTRGESELKATRHELGVVKTEAVSYLEHLRTREWRHGFDLNLFRELDAEMGEAQAGRSALEAERDQLRRQLAEFEEWVAARDVTIGRLQAALAAESAAREAAREAEAAARESAAAADKAAREAMARETEIAARQAASEATARETEVAAREAARDAETAAGPAAREAALAAEQTAREAAVAAADAARDEEVQRVRDLLAAAQAQVADAAARAAHLEAQAETHEQEMTVLLAHLREARRPAQSNDGQLTEDNRALRLELERIRGLLEERESHIRRLERNESNNADLLERIQTNIERLGKPVAAPAAPPADRFAELIRIDGGTHVSYPLARRTRIGRAPGCELHIDSSSVSRHHAVVLMGPRDTIIEDLNSTNGVLINGRKISRQPLNDGDLVVIGEVRFRFSLTRSAGVH